MKFYIKSGDNFSEQSHYGHIKGVEKMLDLIDSYTEYHRVLILDWKEIPVKLVETDASIKHPTNNEALNLVFQNIDTKSKNFGDQYIGQVNGWKLHKIKFIFEQHKFQILVSPVFQIIVLIVIAMIVNIYR